MSKARSKGTRGENWLLEKLRTIWPTAERAPLKGTLDKGDFVNVPWPVEMKNTQRPLFQAWVRILRKKATDHRWILVWKGDARTGDGQPLVVLDFEHAMDLLHAYYGPFGTERADG